MKEIIKIKKNGKKAIFIVLLLGGISVFAQMGVTIVEDINNDLANQERQASMLKQLQEAETQSSKLQGMKETLTKNLEYLEQVNSNLNNVQQVRNIAKRQAQLFNNCVKLKQQYSRGNTVQVALYTVETTNQILQQTQDNINELSKILSSGVFNMNDAERLQLIKGYEENTESAMAKYDMAKITAEKYAWASKVYSMK